MHVIDLGVPPPPHTAVVSQFVCNVGCLEIEILIGCKNIFSVSDLQVLQFFHKPLI